MSTRPPRIAIDGHTLGGRAGGNESYVLGLLEGLQAGAPRCEVVLYLRSGTVAPGAPGLNLVERWLRSRSSLRRLLLELPAALRRDRPDLAHFQYIGPPRSPCPVTIAIHDTSFLHAPELLPRATATRLRRTTGWTVRRAAAVLVPSAWTAQSLSAAYPDAAGKIHVVPLAPSSAFAARSGATEDAGGGALEGGGPGAPDSVLPDRFCLYVGRRQRRKNVAFLVRAYAAARARDAGVPPLLLLGPEGRADASLRRLASTLGVADSVLLRGYASTRTLTAAYRRAEFFCYPCRYEGFGLPLAEALACGCAALAADEGGLPETLGDAGRLLPPQSESAWAGAIVALTRDAAARRELARRGPRQVGGFSWARTVEGWLAAARAAGIARI
jgi:glycosyltransferase involved in cell wall biosynthesis